MYNTEKTIEQIQELRNQVRSELAEREAAPEFDKADLKLIDRLDKYEQGLTDAIGVLSDLQEHGKPVPVL